MQHSTSNPPVSSTRSLTRPDRIRLTRAAAGLKPAEKLLLRSLVDFMGNSAECWPSLTRLATEVGISVRHCRRLLRSLEAAGWIVTRYRFRPDRSQASCVFTWSKAPDTHVRPPRTSVSALENIQKKETQKTYAAPAECDLSEPEKPAAPELIPVAEERAQICSPSQSKPPAVAKLGNGRKVGAQICASTQDEAPAAQSKRSPRFIVIDGSKFLDIIEARRVYLAAVDGKLLNAGPVDRLAFFACWCSVAAKLRAGHVRHPERMMRFLLDNRKVMSAYPDHPAEVKAREAIRHLWPERPYNPHG